MITDEQKYHRIEVCVDCEHNQHDTTPKCAIAKKSISILTTEETESCPEDNW